MGARFCAGVRGFCHSSRLVDGKVELGGLHPPLPQFGSTIAGQDTVKLILPQMLMVLSRSVSRCSAHP